MLVMIVEVYSRILVDNLKLTKDFEEENPSRTNLAATVIKTKPFSIGIFWKRDVMTTPHNTSMTLKTKRFFKNGKFLPFTSYPKRYWLIFDLIFITTSLSISPFPHPHLHPHSLHHPYLHPHSYRYPYPHRHPYHHLYRIVTLIFPLNPHRHPYFHLYHHRHPYFHPYHHRHPYFTLILCQWQKEGLNYFELNYLFSIILRLFLGIATFIHVIKKR